MIVFFVAASLSAAAVQSVSDMPIFGPDPGRCHAVTQAVRENQAETFRRLDRLPRPWAEYAVMRRIDGCTVPAPMGYHPPAPPAPSQAKP